MPAQALRAAAARSSACTWKRSARSSTGAPNSTSRLLCAGTANAQRRVRSPRPAASSTTDGLSARAAGCATRRKRSLSPGRSWPIFHSSVVDDGDRADEAAEARAVGPEDHRHVAGEVHAADGVGVVVDVGRMQSRLAAVVARPRRASGRSAARRCGWSCSALPIRRRRSASMSSGVKKSGRAMRAVGHADLPGVRSSGRSRARRCAWQPSSSASCASTVAARRRRAARGRRGRRIVRA